MAKSSFNRREFLKISALGTTAMALSNCTSLDRYFMGDNRDLKNEVVILGGGAAGLAAAFELKKRKIPFRIFEASSRVGGRVQSVNVFPEDGAVAELGAEFFEASHGDVFDIAKELNLSVTEVKTPTGIEAHLFSFSGKVYRVQDIAPRMKTLRVPLRRVYNDLFRGQDEVLSYQNALKIERSAYYDSLSLRDLLDSWKGEVDPLVLKLVEAQAVNRFGLDAEEQSSLHFLSTVEGDSSSLLTGYTVYRMDAGLTEMMQTLAARVGGVIPDQILRLNSPLIKISEKGGTFELTFEGAKGKETYTTRNVICTIPFSKLREVSGIESLEFSDKKSEAIAHQAYGTHTKGIVSFADPFWRQRRGSTVPNLGNFTGDFLTQKMWDSGRGQSNKKGLMTFQRAGKSGLAADVTAPDLVRKDLGLFYQDVPSFLGDSTEVLNWQRKKWSAGSMAVFKPGQYMRFKGVAMESEYEGRFQFAGEHTSLMFAGTLQGALESGKRAASQVVL